MTLDASGDVHVMEGPNHCQRSVVELRLLGALAQPVVPTLGVRNLGYKKSRSYYKKKSHIGSFKVESSLTFHICQLLRIKEDCKRVKDISCGMHVRIN